ncbi:MAG: hypothetical protein M8467_20065, partial [Anaerolineae bacterium]|nr:hypothetical protein [Anaerolineae bacterium]
GSPLLLTTQRVFLPFVTRAGFGAVASPSAGQPTDRATLAASAFVSELSAISRNENHLALFGVDGLGQLWVKEWTSVNASDWRDTQWVKLMAGVKQEKPAVASRNSNHLVVAVRDTSGGAHTIEWSAQTGWGAPVSLGKTFFGPLALAAADTNGVFLFGLNEQNLVRSLHWTVDAGWLESETGPQVGLQDQVISAVVRRPGDVMVFARMGGPGQGLWRHFTSQGRDLTQTDRSLVPPQDELYRNQVVARVGSRSYYLAADQAAGGTWEIEGYDLDGDVVQSPLILTDHPYVHPYVAGSPVAVVAGDLDFDGSDEIVVVTYAGTTARLTVLDLTVANPGTNPTLSLAPIATVAESFAAAPAVDLSLALGDLNGDGRRNEVALAATLDSQAGDDPLLAVAKLYQFVADGTPELQEKTDGFLTIDDDSPWDGHWELEVAAGRLDWSYPGEQLAVAISGERGCPGCYSMRGFVNTYGILTSGSHWTFVSGDDHLAVREGDPLEFPGSPGNLYRSALATGDLDADGYEEIAAWYLGTVYTIDLNDPDAPTIKEWGLEPKGPANNAQYFQSPRSLALDDLDRDGRAEIVAAAWLQDANTAEYGFHFALLELLGDGALALTRYGPVQLGREKGSVLVGDVDGDGLVSELVGCNTFGEYTVVAVVNGLPRWYENGQPVFGSTGSYSVEEGGGSSQSSGTT